MADTCLRRSLAANAARTAGRAGVAGLCILFATLLVASVMAHRHGCGELASSLALVAAVLSFVAVCLEGSRHRRDRAVLAFGLLTLIGNASAQVATPAAPAAGLAAFEQRFRATNPGTRIDSIAVSPVAGLYEVVMGKNVAYVEPSGRYALFGHLYDMQAQRDLTADRKADLDRVDVARLPKELAIKTVRGAGERALYVFSDPMCGFCKALEQSLPELDNVTVYTFLTPILGPESKRLAAAISCSHAPAEAWVAWMRKGEQPKAPSADCASTGDAVEKLAQSLGVSGTPTLVAGDGRKNAGAMSAQQLGAWLAAGGRPISNAAATPKTKAP